MANTVQAPRVPHFASAPRGNWRRREPVPVASTGRGPDRGNRFTTQRGLRVQFAEALTAPRKPQELVAERQGRFKSFLPHPLKTALPPQINANAASKSRRVCACPRTYLGNLG